MLLRRLSLFFALLVFISATTIHLSAQSGRTAPTPTPEQREDQERVKVFTEEVRLPVVAFDDYGHFDPSLEMNDVLVLEEDDRDRRFGRDAGHLAPDEFVQHQVADDQNAPGRRAIEDLAEPF